MACRAIVAGMTQISSYALRFVGATAANLARTGADLLIVESALTLRGAPPTLTASEIAALQAEGQRVIAYVNSSVTDHGRLWWRGAWVTPDPAAGEPDVGTVSPRAPTWLRNNLGLVDFAAEADGPPQPEAILVDYTHPEWQALVIRQALMQVRAGYDGVFLDDVARYYEAGLANRSQAAELADAMMRLVIAVSDAIRAENPEAMLVVNSGVYILGDSTGDPALIARYRAALDGMLIENHFLSASVLQDAALAFPDAAILPLESHLGFAAQGRLLASAITSGMLPYITPSEAYADFATTPVLGTNGADRLTAAAGVAHLMAVGSGADRLTGAGKADRIWGHQGADTLAGRAGSDTLAGGAGADIFVMNRNNGHDRIMDFTDGVDRLHLGALEVTWAEVQAALTDTGPRLRLDLGALGGTGSVTLTLADLAQLGRDDVIL